ncbi:MAG TPA: DNA glycosylase [Candidatus Binatia bacterium]|jgi:N-glycosylase/DNA lyase|nr:DNA glycosylase [Candidatus Binatia bacterium]
MTFPVCRYDLAATLTSGQAFRWRLSDGAWVGVIGAHWVRLRIENSDLIAESAVPSADWSWLTDYLQLDLDLDEVLQTFPTDEPMQKATSACLGLRLLLQDPWECLASFILSSTKQIVQIRQIIALLCERYGEPLLVPPGQAPLCSFPSPARLASATETDLRGCKMGFRAPYLLATAQQLAEGRLDLPRISRLPVAEARAELIQLPGVGRKIADCVLLFAYGFHSSFPVDVWVMKALRQLYFPHRRVKLARLHRFAATHFGPHAGYAQQYLFHYMRTQNEGGTRPSSPRRGSARKLRLRAED